MIKVNSDAGRKNGYIDRIAARRATEGVRPAGKAGRRIKEGGEDAKDGREATANCGRTERTGRGGGHRSIKYRTFISLAYYI